MVSHSFPSPLTEGNMSAGPRNTTCTSKSAEPNDQISKLANASASAAAIHHHDVPHSAGMGGRHQRVRKACERCRIKKIKCDGELPCKRCKDACLICTPSVRQKAKYKQLPRGYAEVLESTQMALIATIHKLYNMVRESQPWELGEPSLNDLGMPVIHDITRKLGCIRQKGGIELPIRSIFPEDEDGMAKVAGQVAEQQQKDGNSQNDEKSTNSTSHLGDRASSKLTYSGIEDYRKSIYGTGNAMTRSPQSFVDIRGFDFSPNIPGIDLSAMLTSQTQSMPNMSALCMPKSHASCMTMHFLQQAECLHNTNMLNQSFVDSDFGTIKPDILSCPNANVKCGLWHPMTGSGLDAETMQL